MGVKKDISGQKFGMLTAIEPTGEKYQGSYLWRCRCECGGEIDARIGQLTHGDVKSCGCISKKNLSLYPREEVLGQTENTNVSRLRNASTPQVNTSTGVRGVCYNKRKGKYVAYIYFQKKRYHLGYYAALKDAAAIRKAAEQTIFGDFLAWYDRQKKKT